MTFISHTLFLQKEIGEIPIEIKIQQPNNFGPSWTCRYEIDWPEGRHVMVAHGVDALQSLVLAMQMIGSEIYSSAYHKEGALRSANREDGYGFPLPPFLRDLLVGSDKLTF